MKSNSNMQTRAYMQINTNLCLVYSTGKKKFFTYTVIQNEGDCCWWAGWIKNEAPAVRAIGLPACFGMTESSRPIVA